MFKKKVKSKHTALTAEEFAWVEVIEEFAWVEVIEEFTWVEVIEVFEYNGKTAKVKMKTYSDSQRLY